MQTTANVPQYQSNLWQILAGAIDVIRQSTMTFVVGMVAVALAIFAGAWVYEAIGPGRALSAQHLGLGLTVVLMGFIHFRMMDALKVELTDLDRTTHALASGLAIGLTGCSMAAHGHYDLGTVAHAAILVTGIATLPAEFYPEGNGYPRIPFVQAILPIAVLAAGLWLLPAAVKLAALPVVWMFCMAFAASAKRIQASISPTTDGALA